eukprot:scaffold205136_cov49-Attheya_sp.AAC.2
MPSLYAKRTSASAATVVGFCRLDRVFYCMTCRQRLEVSRTAAAANSDVPKFSISRRVTIVDADSWWDSVVWTESSIVFYQQRQVVSVSRTAVNITSSWIVIDTSVLTNGVSFCASYRPTYILRMYGWAQK